MKKALLVTLFLLPAFAMASWSIDKMMATLGPHAGRSTTITATNTGPKTRYVTVHLYHFSKVNGHKHLTLIKRPKNAGVIISPARFVLGAHSKRSYKVTYLGAFPKAMQKAFVIETTEVAAPVAHKRNANVPVAAISMAIRFDTYLFVAPDSVKHNLTVKRLANQVIVSNKGNVALETYVIDPNCSNHGDKSCVRAQNIIMLPGHPHTFKVTNGKKAKITYQYNNVNYMVE